MPLGEDTLSQPLKTDRPGNAGQMILQRKKSQEAQERVKQPSYFERKRSVDDAHQLGLRSFQQRMATASQQLTKDNASTKIMRNMRSINEIVADVDSLCNLKAFTHNSFLQDVVDHK
jgi:hypothetical protein